ncbi:MAG TPA: hypothetical protein VIF62_12625, partial [Labilithrix sp.]
IVIVASLALGGCAKSCRNDHPYVPYAVGDSSAATDADAPPPAPVALAIDAGAIAAEPALVAPPNATTWNVEGLTLRAPEGKELLFAIVRDLDGDGTKDALAIARAPAPKDEPNRVGPAEIVAYVGSHEPRSIVAAPDPRADAGCTPVARLERVGARSAFAEVGSVCAQGAASRSLFVLRLTRDPSVAFEAQVADPPGAAKLTVDVDGADRDGDGIDDIALRVTIEGGAPPFEPGPKLGARIAYFDRSAGPSRDPDEPEASLRAIAAHASARAAKAKDAPDVRPIVEQMRALYRAMCQEGGTPRITKGRAGTPIPCGATKSLDDAELAEVRAFVAIGDPIRAVAAADRLDATRLAKSKPSLADVLAQAAPLLQDTSARALLVTVPARGPHPEWSPLAFEPGGKLLVRTGTKVVRVDPETGGEEDASDVALWPTQVLSPDGKSRWLEAYHACEGVALRTTFVPTGADGDVRDVLLPIAPPLGTRCGGGRGEAASTLPIAWADRGLEAIVAGEPVLVKPETGTALSLAAMLDQQPPRGSPRSPGAKTLAIPTKTGVLVKTPAKALRYRAPELEPYADLRCVVTDDARRLACEKRGRVVLATYDPP